MLFIYAIIGNAIFLIMLAIAIQKKNKPWIILMIITMAIVNVFFVLGYIQILESCRINGLC